MHRGSTERSFRSSPTRGALRASPAPGRAPPRRAAWHSRRPAPRCFSPGFSPLSPSGGLLSPKVQRNHRGREEPERERRRLGLGPEKPVTGHPRHVTRPVAPVLLGPCIFHIWKKESSPDFSEAPLTLFSSSLCQAPRCQPEAATPARAHGRSRHHHVLLAVTSEPGEAGCRAERYLRTQRAWPTLRGKVLPKSIFIDISLLYGSCLYICIDVLLCLLNSYIIHSSTDIWPEILETRLRARRLSGLQARSLELAVETDLQSRRSAEASRREPPCRQCGVRAVVAARPLGHCTSSSPGVKCDVTC